MASSSSSSSSSARWIYDVFLSFRGEDTRYGFISHLYAALDRMGINSYKDDETLRRGLEISPELLEAIESSRCAIVVFSEHYATSRWCLDELVKILHCKRDKGQTVLPIFYHVEPSNVRKPEAFPKTTRVEEDVPRWQEALTKASEISGLSSHDARSESQLIEKIASFVFDKLNSGSTSTAKELVGIDSRIKEIKSLLRTRMDDVQFVGIWGMGGIGKTTIAQVVYEQIHGDFDGSCFLADVKDSNLVHLQEMLLCKILMVGRVSIESPNFGANVIKQRLRYRKVLIVLDDVDELEQLQALAENCDWFGSGSRILITTRDERLLIQHNVERIYKAKELNHQEAVELFCRKAFRMEHPPNDFVELSAAIINYASGLPLALEVLGSSLYKRGTSAWEETLHKLKMCPDKKIQRKLRISYDALDDQLKNLLLDIACFFKGYDKDYLFMLLESCDFVQLNFNLLIEKSLITIRSNVVWMHDLLQEMGRDIVYRESPEEPGKRSRLWIRDDVIHVLTKNTGTEAVRGIVFDLYGQKEVTFNSQAFVKMPNLRFLKICCMQSAGRFDYLSEPKVGFRERRYAMPNKPESLKSCKVHLLGGFKVISDRLRCLHWSAFPLKSLPSRFHPENLVELNMCYSNLRQLWEGAMVFEKLRYMKLSYSTNLTKTPDFSGAPNLESLILEGCTNLIEVHPSLGVLKRLILLNMKDCAKLKYLPGVIELDSLKFLYLTGCLKLRNFPETLRPIPYVRELYLEGTSIKTLPIKFYFTSLVTLNLGECKHLESLPSSICMLQSLKELNLSCCSKLKELPEELGNLTRLVTLNMGKCKHLESLPRSIRMLQSLKVLTLSGCSKIRELPEELGNLTGLYRLNLGECEHLGSLPRSIGMLQSLVELTLCRCSELKELPEELGNLTNLFKLNLGECKHLESLPRNIGMLQSLVELTLSRCSELKELPEELGNLAGLQRLYVDRTAISNLTSSIVLLKNLRRSCLLFSDKGQIPETLKLPPLTGLSSLYHLDISGCDLLTLPDDISCLSSLGRLYLSQNRFTTLPSSISRLSELAYLYVDGCETLQALPQLPSSVYMLVADNCPSLEILKSSIPECLHLGFSNCTKLLENQVTDDLFEVQLQNQLQVPNPEGCFDFIIPGREIPKWFIDHQNMGDTISVKLPPNWYDSLIGIAMCVVFESRGENHPIFSKPAWGGYAPTFGGYQVYAVTMSGLPDVKSNGKHLWVGYVSLDIPWGPREGVWWDDITDISIWFESIPNSVFAIEKCAAHLVHGEYLNKNCPVHWEDLSEEHKKIFTASRPSGVQFGEIFFGVRFTGEREGEHDQLEQLVEVTCLGTEMFPAATCCSDDGSDDEIFFSTRLTGKREGEHDDLDYSDVHQQTTRKLSGTTTIQRPGLVYVSAGILAGAAVLAGIGIIIYLKRSKT